MEKIYEFLNQYDRKVYIEGESVEHIIVKTENPSLIPYVYPNIETYNVVGKAADEFTLDKIIKSTVFKEVADIPFTVNKINGLDCVDIEIAEYSPNLCYVAIENMGGNKTISMAERVSVLNNGKYLISFSNLKSELIESIKSTIVFNSYNHNAVYAKNHQLSVGDSLFGLSHSMYQHKHYCKDISFISKTLSAFSASNISTFNTKDIPENIIIVDYVTNTLYNKTSADTENYITEKTTAFKIGTPIHIRTDKNSLRDIMSQSQYSSLSFESSIFVVNGKIVEIGTDYIGMSGISRKVSIYPIEGSVEFTLPIKTFKTPENPSRILLASIKELDINTYSPSVQVEYSSYEESSTFKKTIKSNKKSFEIQLKDSDENRDILEILKRRYKIISERCDNVLW